MTSFFLNTKLRSFAQVFKNTTELGFILAKFIGGVVRIHTVINNFNSYPQQLQFIPNFDVRLSQFIPNQISKSEWHNSYHLNKRQRAQFIPYKNFCHQQAQFIPAYILEICNNAELFECRIGNISKWSQECTYSYRQITPIIWCSNFWEKNSNFKLWIVSAVRKRFEARDFI